MLVSGGVNTLAAGAGAAAVNAIAAASPIAAPTRTKVPNTPAGRGLWRIWRSTSPGYPALTACDVPSVVPWPSSARTANHGPPPLIGIAVSKLESVTGPPVGFRSFWFEPVSTCHLETSVAPFQLA